MANKTNIPEDEGGRTYRYMKEIREAVGRKMHQGRDKGFRDTDLGVRVWGYEISEGLLFLW